MYSKQLGRFSSMYNSVFFFPSRDCHLVKFFVKSAGTNYFILFLQERKIRNYLHLIFTYYQSRSTAIIYEYRLRINMNLERHAKQFLIHFFQT